MSKFSFSYTHSHLRCWSHGILLVAFILTLYSLSPAAKTWLSGQVIIALGLVATVLFVCLGIRRMTMPTFTSRVSVSNTLWNEYSNTGPAAVFTLCEGGMLAPFGILICMKDENGVLHRRWILPGECDDKSYRRLARLVLNSHVK
ncbi:protein YgfX [Aestuariibacter sp. A3R04]|uniref:protein YgfX n=1 Tax=Aestuariibacter sp. A3R04 TaxID=2841571 RepID=UPI00352FA422